MCLEILEENHAANPGLNYHYFNTHVRHTFLLPAQFISEMIVFFARAFPFNTGTAFRPK